MKRTTETRTDQPGPVQRLVSLLAESPRMTASEIGNALWAKREQGDIAPARFARPAGRLLARARKAGLVYCCYNVDEMRNVWYARKQANDPSSPTRPMKAEDCNKSVEAGLGGAPCYAVRPRALDLFCCAGGASMGMHRAGFDVTGVDIAPQPRYPFEFILGDALKADLRGYDFVWASPPCQRYTRAQNASKNAAAHPDLIAPMREKLEAWGGLWIMENVVGAPLRNPATLCGLALGLNVKRHRLFESNMMLLTPSCPSHDQDYYVIFGHEVRNRVRMGADPKGTRCGRRNDIAVGRKAMGIDWMTRGELSEAIPPAYSEFLCRQVLRMRQSAHAA